MKLIDPATGQAVWDSNDPYAGPVPPAPEGRQWVRVDEPGDTMAPRLRAPGILDIGNGVTERLAFLNQTFNPVEGIGSAMRAGSRMMAPDQSYWDRIASLGEMASGVASIAAPIAAAKAIGVPAASAMMEGLLGWSPTQQAAGEMATQFARSESGALPGGGPGRAPLDVSRRDASNIFGEGSERVRYTDPQSGGTIEVVVRPDGSASVLELEVPEGFRGQGIGQRLQERVMQDFPTMGGQVSSKAAATTAYRLGRRPLGQPNATLDEVFAMIDDMSSVNLVSPEMQARFGGTAAPAGIKAYHGSPHDFDRFSMSKIGTGEGAQAYGQGLYFAENEDVARGYRDRLTMPRDQYGQVIGNPRQYYRTKVDGVDAREGGQDFWEVAEQIAHKGMTYDEYLADLIDKSTWSDSPLVQERFRKEIERAQRFAPDLRGKSITYEPPVGNMYEVEVNANPEDFIDFDAPLSAQSPTVQRQFGYVPRPTPQEEVAAYELAKRESPNDIGNHPAVQDIYRREAGANAAERNFQRQITGGGVDEAARITLSEAGIPGIRYLDAGSRGAGDGSRNYVIFDENLINIVRKYGIAGAAAMLGVSAFDVEQALAENMSPSQWDQLVVGPQ